ncbi:MAG: hypothetical protein PHT12_03650 [Patescibacteria group bacterium]|nr:hypothetical protein [Patescibacteria group bacterium]
MPEAERESAWVEDLRGNAEEALAALGALRRRIMSELKNDDDDDPHRVGEECPLSDDQLMEMHLVLDEIEDELQAAEQNTELFKESEDPSSQLPAISLGREEMESRINHCFDRIRVLNTDLGEILANRLD